MCIKSNTVKTVEFSKAFKKLDKDQKQHLRETIIGLTGWKSRNTFYGKLNGSKKMTKSEQAVVELVFYDFGISEN